MSRLRRRKIFPTDIQFNKKAEDCLDYRKSINLRKKLSRNESENEKHSNKRFSHLCKKRLPSRLVHWTRVLLIMIRLLITMSYNDLFLSQFKKITFPFVYCHLTTKRSFLFFRVINNLTKYCIIYKCAKLVHKSWINKQSIVFIYLFVCGCCRHGTCCFSARSVWTFRCRFVLRSTRWHFLLFLKKFCLSFWNFKLLVL